MPSNELPPASLTLSKSEARRFLLAHQMLWPPRRLQGKAGILQFIRRVGTIQFDPINIVGRNPDLVLQSRVRNYRPHLLDALLYQDRELLDGWDKMASIYLTSDWPHFARHRQRMRREHGKPSNPQMKAASYVMAAIRERGPQSSIDFKDENKIPWSWGTPTTLARAALEILHAMGKVLVHHRVGSRRVFELTERLLPRELLTAEDPIEHDADYQAWHVLRRIGGLGLASPSASDYWLAIHGVKSETRRSILNRLVEGGELLAVAIEEVPDQTFFMRRTDLESLKAVTTERAPRRKAAILGPLDNLMWHRNVVRWIFDFDYTWEVYKPAGQRKHGYYVLPILHGDQLVARFDPAFDRTSRELTFLNWWWEDGIRVEDSMQSALLQCVRDFMDYLRADRIRLAPKVSQDKTLRWMSDAHLAG